MATVVVVCNTVSCNRIKQNTIIYCNRSKVYIVVYYGI